MERDLTELCGKEFSKYNDAQESQRNLIVSEEAVSYLAQTGFSIRYGARFLKRSIDEKVKIPVTLQWKEGSVFKVDVKDDKLSITWE